MIRECLIGLSAVILTSITIASPSRSEMPGACADEPGRVVQCVVPSATDAAIVRFDKAHLVFFDAKTRPDADLLVFLPGTNGVPYPLPFLKQAADAGYRVVSLAYNDTPSAAVYCPRKPDPSCSEQFRRMRIYGDGISLDPAIDNTTADSIVNRLVKLLQYLDRDDPQEQWSRYLENGEPIWSRILGAASRRAPAWRR